MDRVRLTDGQEFGPADLDTIVQWAREGRIPRDALLYSVDGGEPRSVFAEPRLAAILAAPPTQAAALPAASKDSPWFMPTGNQPAIWGYYISVFSFLVPVLCPVSLILGGVGVVRAVTRPEAKGLFHAIAAILLSVAAPTFWWFVFRIVAEW